MVGHAGPAAGGQIEWTCMMGEDNWTKGDRVVHSGKPEWGLGHVLQAEPGVHEGRNCQRLTIRFERAGMKTISTAFAELRRSDGLAAVAEERPDDNDPLAKASDAASVAEVMTRLPESMTDPFTSLRKRFAATLDGYRFGDGPSALLDWAAIQTGMKDPLSRFNRHELELWFTKFRVELDQHVKKLARELRKAEPPAIDEFYDKASPAARMAIKRADFGR